MNFRQNTTDAFEKSLIEDYYNSINDSLKSRLKKYNNYIDVNTGLKRIKSYYQQTETEMFQLVQKEVAISNEIEIQRNKLESIKSNENVSFAILNRLLYIFNSIIL
jgi:hypothetical protein